MQSAAMENHLSEEDVRQILVDFYGIVPKTVRELVGFICQNFVIRTEGDADAEATSKSTDAYILKIISKDHQSPCESLDLQHAMQRHLAADGITTSQPILSRHDRTVVDYRRGDKEYAVQLLSFLKGIALVDAALTKHDVLTLAEKTGRFVGRIHKSLRDLQYEAKVGTVENEYHPEQALSFRNRLKYETKEDMKRLLEKHFNLFEQNVLPRLQSLRKAYSHSDISNANIIVQKREEWEIVGLIDFEDSYFGYLVGDLGISIAYVLLQAGFVPDIDVMDVCKRAIRAYDEIFPLTCDERAVLYEMITSRIVVSYLTAREKTHFQPDNSKVWFRQSLHAPTVLETIDKANRTNLESDWFPH